MPLYFLCLTFLLCLALLIYSLPKAQSAGRFFNQTDWSQGANVADEAIASDWSKYYSADDRIDASGTGELKLSLEAGLFVDTADEDFAKGTIDSTLTTADGSLALGHSLGVNEYTVGTLSAVSVTASQVSDSSPWTVSFSNSPNLSRVFKSDKFTDSAANAYKILSVSDALNQIIVADSEANHAAPAAGSGMVGRWYSSLSAWEDARDGNGDADLTAIGRNAIERALCYYDGAPDSSNLVIDGWTTDAMHYIEIYVPPSQRHNGVWSEEAYTLTTTSDKPNISIKEDYTKIEGLQVQSKSTGSHYAIGVTGKQVEISGNIIKGANSATRTNWTFGILLTDQGGAKISNNIIYHFTSANMRGRGITGGTSAGINFAYNNTVYGCDVGIDQGQGSTWTLRNNISYRSNRNYQGTFSAQSSHNLSGPLQDDAPGASPQNVSYVNFIDEAAQDFRLMSSDINAKNNGMSLSADANLAFSTDIDLSIRSGSWDIGADEASASFTMTHSIGTGSTRHFSTLQAWEDARGGNLLTRHIFKINNQSGAFTEGETVTFSSGASGTYIKERDVPSNSETYMTLDDVAGMFTLDEVLTGGTSGAKATLVDVFTVSGTIEKGEVHNDSPLTAGVLIAGALTDSDHYMMLTAAPNSRHAGTAGTGAKIDMQKAKTSAITIGDSYTVVEWLEIVNWSGAGAGIKVYGGANSIIIANNIIHDNDAPGTAGSDDPAAIELNSDRAQMEASNNIIYNILSNTGAKKTTGISVSTSTATRVFNNIIYNVSGTGIDNNQSVAAVAEKNIVVGNGKDFEGRYTPDSDYNISSDMSAPGANSLTKKSVSDLAFVSTVVGAEDLHTMAGSAAREINLNLPADTSGRAVEGEQFSSSGGYNRKGIFVSQAYDTDSHPLYQTMTWTAAVPAHTSLELKVRTSHDSQMSSATDWAFCPAVVNNDNLDSSPCVTDGEQYIQYRAEFSSENGVTPQLDDVTIAFEGYPQASQELISSPFNTGVENNSVDQLSWEETLHTGVDGVKIQLRSAPDENGTPGLWGDWLGPQSTDDHYEDSTQDVQINPAHQDGTEDQWVQYKVQLFTSGLSTPVLSGINIVFGEGFAGLEIPQDVPPEPTIEPEPVAEPVAEPAPTPSEEVPLDTLIETSPRPAGTKQYDVLIKLGDNHHPDPQKDASDYYKHGDVVVVRLTGHKWTKTERNSFLIVQMYMSEEEAADLAKPQVVDTGKVNRYGKPILKRIRVRAKKIDMHKLGFSENEFRSDTTRKKLRALRNSLKNKVLKKRDVVKEKAINAN